MYMCQIIPCNIVRILWNKDQSLNGISERFDAARFVFRIVESLWKLIGVSAALLPRRPSNFAAIQLYKLYQSHCFETWRDLSCEEMTWFHIKAGLWYLREQYARCTRSTEIQTIGRCTTECARITHWGRVTHICLCKLTIIGSDNCLSPSRRQAIFWTSAGILLIWPLGTNFNEILI